MRTAKIYKKHEKNLTTHQELRNECIYKDDLKMEAMNKL